MSVKLFKLTMKNNLSDGVTIPIGYRLICYGVTTAPDGSVTESSSSSQPAGLWAFGGTDYYAPLNGHWDTVAMTSDYSYFRKEITASSNEGSLQVGQICSLLNVYATGTWHHSDSDPDFIFNNDWIWGLCDKDSITGNNTSHDAAGNISYDVSSFGAYPGENPDTIGYTFNLQEKWEIGDGDIYITNKLGNHSGNLPTFTWIDNEGVIPGGVLGPGYLFLKPSGTNHEPRRIGDYGIWDDWDTNNTFFPPYREKMIFNGGDLVTYRYTSDSPHFGVLIGMLLDSNGIPVPEATVRSLFSGYDIEFTTYNHS